jgi:hypothetical protein
MKFKSLIDPDWLRKELRSVREDLLNKNSAIKITDFLIETTLKNILFEEQEEDLPVMFALHMHESAFYAINIFHKYAGSPIEIIFLTSFLISVIVTMPFALIVDKPYANTPEMIYKFRNYHKWVCETWDSYHEVYKESNVTLNDFFDFLDELVDKGVMKPTDKEHYILHFFRYRFLLDFNSTFHLTLQAGFPEFKVDGRGIRPDIFIWLPGNEITKIIVECDGFKTHSQKDIFISDRKRDRLFRLKGYEVLRYSGSEIHQDPLEVGFDLIEHLKTLIK